MYSGIAEIKLDNQEMADFYEDKLDFGKIGLLVNQYALIEDLEGKVVDRIQWTNDGCRKVKYKSIKNEFFGEIKARNEEQCLALDLLFSDKITGVLLIGGFGSGKTMLSLCYALDQVTKQKYDKIVFLRNNIEVKNSVPVGALPGGLNEKIKPYAMSLADIIGSETALDRMIEDEIISLDHIGFIRGRSYRNSIIILSEAQNVTREHMALVVARIGEGSRLIVEGDVHQCDRTVFEKDSGIYHLAESLKGDEEFGMVTLKKNERSRFASLSNKILGIEE
jgi:PhoH-like ATPase